MVVIILIFIISICPLQSDSGLGFGGLGVFQKSLEKKEEGQESQFERVSNGFAFLNPRIESEENKILTNMSLYLLGDPAASDRMDFYIAKNFYGGYNFESFQIFFGRKEFISTNLPMFPMNDGNDGIVIEKKFLNSFTLTVSPMDYYSGFQNFSDSYLRNYSDSSSKSGNRYRQTIQIGYDSDRIKIISLFSYLNLGSWGVSSSDRNKTNPSGDEDFVYNANLNFEYKIQSFRFGFNFLLSRGIDKTTYNRERQNSFLPISGEAIYGFLGFQKNGFSISSGFFLPDADKRNSGGEILELGYVGMGTGLPRGFLLTRFLDFYPSVWITPYGLEKSESTIHGRNYSFYSPTILSYTINDFKFEIIGEYILPISNMYHRRGRIETDKKYFSKSFLSEISFQIQYGSRNSGSFFTQISFSKLYTSNDIQLKGESFSLSGGVYY